MCSSDLDLIVTLEETKKLYEYINFAFNVLSNNGRNPDNDFSKCGFVRVNNDSLIPYTVLKDGDKSVPLFYFEGQTEILKEKAEVRVSWTPKTESTCFAFLTVVSFTVALDRMGAVLSEDMLQGPRCSKRPDCW